MVKFSSIILACIFVLSGCATPYIKVLRNHPVTNWILLHQNPKAGDYAVYETKDEDEGFRVEVIKVDKDLIHIRKSATKASYFESAVKNHVYNYMVRPNGKVVQAYFETLDTKERFPLKISKPGDTEYFKDPKSNSINWNEIITTKKGSFEVKKVVAFNTIKRSSSGATRFNYRFFLNPTVKFGYVRMHLVYVINFTEDTSSSAGLAKELNSNMGQMDSLASGISNLIAGGAHEYVLDLIESN